MHTFYDLKVCGCVVGLRDGATVISSHAIFPHDGGMEAAEPVVGLCYQHSALFSQFMIITSKTVVSEACLYPLSYLACNGLSQNNDKEERKLHVFRNRIIKKLW